MRPATPLYADGPLMVMTRPLNPVLGEYVIRSRMLRITYLSPTLRLADFSTVIGQTPTHVG